MHGLGFCLRACGAAAGNSQVPNENQRLSQAGHTEADTEPDGSGLHMNHPALGAAPRSTEGESHRWEEAT
jgi:hypothetical protein